jgi:ribokinase
MLQLEIPLDTVRSVVELAAAAGVPVILDPAPAAPLDDALLGQITYLTPNESEAEGLTGLAVDDEASARAAARKLLDAGARHVIVTLGTKGALVAGADRAGLIPAFTVEALDSTAAGDAFNGGLAVALARGASLDEAVREASLVGALSVTRLGAQPSLPSAEEVRRFAESVAG